MTVVNLEVSERGAYHGGAVFGETGPYEYLAGVLHFAIDPAAPANQHIADIRLAPTNAKGQVEFSAEFHLLKPVNPPENGRLLVDSTNRGNMTALAMFNGAGRRDSANPDVDPGNGYLFRAGYSLLALAIQWDPPKSPERMRAFFPEALQDGRRLQGPSFLQWWPNTPTQTMLLSDAGHTPYPTANVEDQGATLTVRDHHDDAPRVIPRNEWQFARLENGVPVADPKHCCLPGGFQPGKVYELTYTAEGAPVIGLGFAGYRDTASFFKYADSAAGNPLAGRVTYAYGWGQSMNGRWLREFLYWGFNQDEHGRQAYDALMPHIGSARRGEFNFRFGQPSTNILRAPGNVYPFAFESTPDLAPEQRQRGLLDRTRANGSMPKVLCINSGMEYWWSGASLAHTTTDATGDLEPPTDVRTYYLVGTQHGPGALPLTNRTVDNFVACNPINVQDYRPAMRALLDVMDLWAREGVEPPASRIPRLADHTAVSREECLQRISQIPGVATPRYLPQRLRMKFGPDDDSAEKTYPPTEQGAYPVLVSALDGDCNEFAGIRLPEVGVPLATYTGWNVRDAQMGGAGQMTSGSPLFGSTIPFATNRSEREASGDTRLSIEERYSSKAAYLDEVRRYALDLVGDRFLLEEDVDRCLAMAAARWDAIVSPKTA
jgi:hypothetical protein